MMPKEKDAVSPVASADDKTRIRIGHYVLGQTLGQGSFGKVKVAEHEITGHKVAVKMINRQKLQHKQMDKKIRREIRILKLLRHPHIIRLYEVIETPSDIFLVMEYVGGGELFEYIVKHGRLSVSAARRFFQQIISGVEHIHHFRVVHRDLKPENVLLDDEGNVKIADFGLSNLMADGDFLQTSCGSPNYAAPEVISGKLYAGPEVDVWSCGVILYALLCGRLPFDEESVPALFKKIKEGAYTMPSHLPTPCRELISRMLVVDPLQRITIAQIREHSWFSEGLPAYMQAPPAAEPGEEKVDMELLRQILDKMDIPLDIGLKALASGTKNDLSVAYHILLDAKKRTPQPCVAGPAPPPKPTEATPPLRAAPIMEDIQSQKRDLEKQARFSYNEATLRVGSPEVGSYWGSRMSCSPAPATPSPLLGDRSLYHTPSPTAPGFSLYRGGASPRMMSHSAFVSTLPQCDPSPADGYEPVHAMHTNWRLGLFSDLPSNRLVSVIYDVLRGLKMKWRVASPFRLLCLSVVSKGKPSGVAIQVFRMHERHDRGYFVDLSILGPDIFPTINLVYEIYISLRRHLIDL